MKDDTHPTVTIVFGLFPRAVQKYLKYIIYLLIVLVGGIMIISGIMLCIKDQAQLTPTLRISYAWVYAAIPTSGALIALQAVGQLWEYIKAAGQKGTVE